MNTPPIVGMILAAGHGTRMSPLTRALPKPLLPFLNTPIIAYTLDHLARMGARRVAINLHHLGERVEPVVRAIVEGLAPVHGPIEVTFVHEVDIAGTAGGVAGMWEALGKPQATAVAINGDALLGADLRPALAAHRASGAPATLLTRPPAGTHPGGVFADDEGLITGLRAQGQRQGRRELDFMGVHFLEPAILARVHEAAALTRPSCMVAEVYTPLLGTALAPRALVNEDYWLALDTPALLLRSTREVLEDPSRFPQAPLAWTHGPGLCITNPAAVHDRARLAGPLFLGFGASVHAGARVGPMAVIEGTELMPGASVRNAVLFGMGRVEGQWEDCVAVNGQIAQLPSST